MTQRAVKDTDIFGIKRIDLARNSTVRSDACIADVGAKTAKLKRDRTRRNSPIDVNCCGNDHLLHTLCQALEVLAEFTAQNRYK